MFAKGSITLLTAAILIQATARADIRDDIPNDVPPGVLKELEPLVHTPPDGIYVYSYQDLSKISALHFTPEEFPQAAGNHYWDQSQDAHTQGHFSGFYFASDPISSRDYAGDGKNFVMYRLELSPKNRILDVHNFSPTAAFSQYEKYVAANGCSDGYFLQNLVNEGYGPKCRALAIKILRAMQIDAIEYSFFGVRFNGCKPEPDTDWALVLIRPDHVSKDHLNTFFSDEKKDPDQGKERSFIRALFAEDLHEPQSDANALLPKTLGFPGSKQAPESELASFKSQHLMNCQNLRAHEFDGNRATSCVREEDSGSAAAKLKSTLEAIVKTPK